MTARRLLSTVAGARSVAAAGLLLGALQGPAVDTSTTVAARPATHRAQLGRPGDIHPRYAGWAMDAYPGDSVAYLKGEMARQLAAGANVVWLGHNNPGDVIPGKVEPALSYAVWAAYRDPHAQHHDLAVAMVAAQRNALDAARSLGARVVLPVGYQTQLGAAWTLAHPGGVRRAAGGQPYNGPKPSDVGASFYAPDYRRDMTAYYRWVDATLVRPYSGTVMMINLADEPKEGDYSALADAAFRAAHAARGYGLRDAGANPARQEAVGRFESDYVADYAAWSAGQWQAIDPAVRVTMSFCGGYGREMHEGPNLESVFSKVPSNFVVTFDGYPRDGLYTTPLTEHDLIALFALVRTLGHYSAAYHRPLWLWSAANSWGLNEGSSDRGGVADAVANGIYLAQLARQTGGDLQGIAVWNYNIKGQGLYNDTHHTLYNPDDMFRRVSASFPLLRRLMAAPAGRPDTVVLAPNEPALRAAGAALALRATDTYRWDALGVLARSNVAAVTLYHLDPSSLPSLRTAIVLARAATDLTPGDRRALRALLAHGGTVVAAAPVAATLVDNSAGAGLVATSPDATLAVRRVPTTAGALLSVDGGAVEELCADANRGWTLPLWSQVLRRSTAALGTTGYIVAFDVYSLFYTIAGGGSTVALDVPVGGGGATVYGSDGGVQQIMHLVGGRNPDPVRLSIARRAYALVTP